MCYKRDYLIQMTINHLISSSIAYLMTFLYCNNNMLNIESNFGKKMLNCFFSYLVAKCVLIFQDDLGIL